MNAAWAAPLAWEDLVACWAGDLELAAVDRLDEHLMGCGVCTAESSRVAALSEAMRTFISPLLDHATLASLRARGLRITENPLLRDERRTVVFPLDTDLLLSVMLEPEAGTVERWAWDYILGATLVAKLSPPPLPEGW